MLLYRITKAKFSARLVASGMENRWNGNGRFVIYAASSAALACLENLVHTGGKLLYTEDYKLVTIEVPDTASATTIHLKDLDPDWQQMHQSNTTQKIGNDWYDRQKSLLLQIPSAIVPIETNFLINTSHADFKRVKIKNIGPFIFDPRLKENQ